MQDNASELAKLSRRLGRERRSRLDAEAIAEKGLRELYEKQQYLQLLEKIADAANQSASLGVALHFATKTVCEFTGWVLGHAYLCEPFEDHNRLVSTAIWYASEPSRVQAFRNSTETTDLGLPGRVLATASATWIADVVNDSNFPRAQAAAAAGIKSAFAFPILVRSEVAAVLEFFSDRVFEPDEMLLRLMSQVGTQLGRVVERKRAEDQRLAAQATQYALDRRRLIDESEEKLREQHLRLDLALNNMSQGLLMFDSEEKIVVVNNQYIQMYGLSPEVVKPGCTLRELLRHRVATGQLTRDPEKYRADLVAQLAEGKIITWIVETADGRAISIVNRPLSGGGWVVTHEDITKQRRAEELLGAQKLQLDTALNNMTQGLNMFDAAGRLLVCNERYRQMYRLAPDAAQPGCTVRDLVDARMAAGSFFSIDPEKYVDDLLAAMAAREPTSTTLELTDGRVIAVLGQPTPTGSGWVTTHEDITERHNLMRARRQAEDQLREQTLQLDTALNNMSQALLMFDSSGRLMICNRRYYEMYGLSPDVIKPGCTIRELIDERQRNGEFLGDLDTYIETLRSTIALGKTSERVFELPDGRTIAVVNHPMAGGGWVATHDDITERRGAEAKISHMAHHDALTDLPNRAAFTKHLTTTLERASAEGGKFAILSIDLDRFKEVNDLFGHSAGDALLREVSRRLQAAAESAFLARLGGDEFMLIAADGPQPSTAEALAERLQGAVADEIEIEGHRLRIGLSIGVAIFPNDGANATTILGNADAGLYRAKSQGRGSIRFFEPDMDQRLRERRMLQHELQTGMHRGELSLHYQPQRRIGGEITGFEALVRWRHPTRGMVPPGTFVPLAEESGLILPLGEWILREACREAASWPRPLHIAVNLSPIQFRHGDLPRLVHSVLLETGLAANRLELEITEGVLIDDFSRALSILRRLKALGVRIAMDDFGTGYSSLSNLQSFPFDKIKIDQSFIHNLESSPQSAAIVRAVLGLGRGLDLPVVAEGVETEAQLAFLASEGCKDIQGYLIGRPNDIAEYAELVGRKPNLGAVQMRADSAR